MKKVILFLMLIFGIISASICQTADNKSQLIVKLIGFRNEKGQVCVSLFNNAKGFPGKYDKAIKIMRSPVKGNQTTVEFNDVPYGTYAIGVLHDENSNNKMDTTFIGMPKEGFGASNNPKPLMGPPSFNESKFDLNSKNKTIGINIKYL